MRSVPFNDHRKFNEASTWIPLFAIQIAVGDIQYLTPSPTAVTVDGHEYLPFPVMLEQLVDDGKGSISTVQLVVSNIEGLLGTKIRQNPGIDGQPVVFRVYSVEAGAVVYEETLEIIKVGPITDQSIAFELGMFNPYTVRLLQEKFLRDYCWNRYKGAGCWLRLADGSYSQPATFTIGAPDSCTHKLTDCDRHTNTQRFNSFPGIPGSGGYV